MLEEGRRRFKQSMYWNSMYTSSIVPAHPAHEKYTSPLKAPQVEFEVANAQALPKDKFPDNTFDMYTIAFGIRNCTSIPDVLREAYRVLKPGGTFACLEFGKLENPALAQ